MLSVLALFLSAAAASAGTIPINGLVVNKGKEPMVGVTVLLKGTSQGVTTDAEGRFFIDVPDKKSVLSFGFVGYQMQEIVVGSRINLHVILEEQVSELDEVVVVGYGTQRKLSVVGAVEGLAPKDLQIGTNRSLSNNLAGQLSGVIAVQRTGEPGKDNSDFWIRGISTFAVGSTPLVLVDGVERSLNDMDPAEIESFSILKDAAASAVYGVRGANGVILINTKRGEVGPPKVSLRYEVAMSEPTKLPEFVDATTYMEVMNAIASDSRITLPFSQKQIGLTKSRYDTDLYPDVDWIDAITKKHAWNQRVNVNVNGGSPVLRYNVTASVYNERGIMERDDSQSWDGSTKLTRYNVRSNVDVDITKTTLLKINIGGYLQRQNKVNHDIEDLFNVAFNTPPFVHPTIYSNGKVARKDGNQNPWALATQTGYQRLSNSKIESQASLEQNLKFITPGLRARVTFAFDSSNASLVRRGKTPDYYNPATGRDDDGNLIMNIASYGQEFLDHASSGEFGEQTTYLEGAVSYSREFGKHYVDAMLLYNQRSYDTGEKLPYRNQGFAGRFSYSYDRRYVAEFNFGYNGSENFAPKKRYGFFPAGSVGWIVSEENFMKNQKVFDDLKFRVGYGVSGNSLGFDAYTAQQTYGASGWFTYVDPVTGSSSSYRTLAATKNANPDLKWERTGMFNIGIDFGFFNNRLTGTIEYYDKRTKDLIYGYKVSTNRYPHDTMTANVGEISNKGIELTINATPVMTRNFTWNTALNIAHNKNNVELLSNDTYSVNYQDYGNPDLGGYATTTVQRLMEGSPVGQFYVWEWAGYNENGGSIFNDYDAEGNLIGTTDAPDDEDRRKAGSAQPKVTFGWNNTFTYKNWSLTAFFQGIAGNKIFNATRAFYNNVTLFNTGKNILKEVATMQKATDTRAQAPSDRYIENGSYLRLASLSLGYDFGKLGDWVNSLKVYATCNNVFTLTGYKGVDPEISLGGMQPGIDWRNTTYPRTRTFMFGVNINF